MNRVVKILMERDGMSKSEAEQEVLTCQNAMLDELAAGDIWAAEETIADYLGLEPDYLEDVLYF